MRSTRRRILILANLLVLALPVGCTPEQRAPGPLGTRCADLVGFYLELGAVDVTREDSEPETGKVQIDYAVGVREGVALCRFRADNGTLVATGALVDENRLRDDEIAAFNASL